MTKHTINPIEFIDGNSAQAFLRFSPHYVKPNIWVDFDSNDQTRIKYLSRKLIEGDPNTKFKQFLFEVLEHTTQKYIYLPESSQFCFQTQNSSPPTFVEYYTPLIQYLSRVKLTDGSFVHRINIDSVPQSNDFEEYLKTYIDYIGLVKVSCPRCDTGCSVHTETPPLTFECTVCSFGCSVEEITWSMPMRDIQLQLERLWTE